MLPYSPGFDLSHLNALRSVMYGGVPPMHAGNFTMPGSTASPPMWGANPPLQQFPFSGQPVPVEGGPMRPGAGLPGQQFQNLMALRALGPQSQMRFPMTQQY